MVVFLEMVLPGILSVPGWQETIVLRKPVEGMEKYNIDMSGARPDQDI